MSKKLTQDEVANHKKNAIRNIDNLLRKYIYSGDEKQLKKANLISYWLETFANYVSFEEKFDPTKQISYSRGDVIRLNFGFNIGKEFGGLHYAVVLDRDSKHHSEVITVVPLSSTEGKAVHPNSIDLGSEIYEKVSVVQKNLRDDVQRDISQCKDMLFFAETSLATLSEKKANLAESEITDDLTDKIEKISSAKASLDDLLLELEESLATIDKNDLEVGKMKKGSMAITNQITTVSKQRIYTPKHSEDFLYGISLSSSAMEKINSKIKELYLFE